jgi:hypothetical protein
LNEHDDYQAEMRDPVQRLLAEGGYASDERLTRCAAPVRSQAMAHDPAISDPSGTRHVRASPTAANDRDAEIGLQDDGRMGRVHIGTADQGLTLRPDVEFVGRPPDVVDAELRLSGLSASVRVVHHYATGFTDLADFFDRLADDWRGWAGVRHWESLEGDLRLEAEHVHRHVRLRVIVRRPLADWGNEGWSATGDLTVDPGEQLAHIAKDVRSLSEGS